MNNVRKTALITGGAKRIGKEFAIHLAKQGYDIALHYFQSENEAQNVKQQIQKLDRKVEIFSCDLSNPLQINNLFKQVLNKFNTLDLLINNASIFFREYFLDNTVEDIQNTLSLNFIAPYLLSQEYAKSYKKGHIINMIDTKISQLETQYFLYSLSKKMVKDLTLMSAKALAPDIRVNGICPGHILMEEKNSKQHLKKKPDNIPLKRNGKINEVIDALDYLIKQPFITGQLLFIDGGEHLS